MAWFDSKHTDGRCLPLEGGTVKGEVHLEKGYVVHEIPYGSPDEGYFHVCRITVKDNYCDSPVCIDYTMRSSQPVRLVIKFTGRENTGDETVSHFCFQASYEDGVSVGAYIHNQSPGIWDLYVKKHGTFGRMVVTGVGYDYGYGRFNIEWCSGFYTSLPGPCTRAVPYTPEINSLHIGSNIVTSCGTGSHMAIRPDSEGASGHWRVMLDSENCTDYCVGIEKADTYPGIVAPEKKGECWIRVPLSGMLPYEPGNINNPHSYLGTEAWCFNESHIKRMCGNTLELDRDATVNSVYIIKNSGCRISGRDISSGNGIAYEIILQPGGRNVPDKGMVLGGNYIYPWQDGAAYLGNGNHRWNQVHAVNGTIQTSDRNEKEEISYIGQESSHEDTVMTDGQLIQLILGLKPVVFKRINGESGRPHHGFIAQDFEELLKNIGIKDHAAFIKSPKIREFEAEREVEKEVTKEDGTKDVIKETIKEAHQEEIPGEYTRGLRYEEFIPDITRFEQILYYMSQEQQKKIESLEVQLKEALNRIEKLEGIKN